MTQVEAEDELFQCLLAAWTVALQTLNIQPAPVIIWPGMATPEPDANYIWCQPTVDVVDRSQKTLRLTLALYEANAIFTVSIFAPKSDPTARRSAQLLGQAIELKVSKQSPSGKIWFRDPRSTPVGGTATQNQVNVVVKCTYQEQQ